MHKSSYNISSFADELVPEHVKVEYPELIEFIKVYALYLERGNESGFFLNQLDHQRDVSLIEESLLGELQNEIGIAIPRTFEADTRLFYKRLIEFYQSKGTPDAIRAFFRLIYDDNVTIYYPKVDILAPSDGKWGPSDFNNIGHSNIWTLGEDDDAVTEVTAKGDNGSYGSVDSIYTITRDGVETICNTCKEIITHIDGACELTNEDATDLLAKFKFNIGSGHLSNEDIGYDPFYFSSYAYWKHGDDSENVRELDIDAHGNESIIWKGTNIGDGDTSNSDGGLQTPSDSFGHGLDIDHEKTYRFSQWINSKDLEQYENSSRVYFGTNGFRNSTSFGDDIGVNMLTNGSFDSAPTGDDAYLEPYDGLIDASPANLIANPNELSTILGWEYIGQVSDGAKIDIALNEGRSWNYQDAIIEWNGLNTVLYEEVVIDDGVNPSHLYAKESGKGDHYYTQSIPVEEGGVYRIAKPNFISGDCTFTVYETGTTNIIWSLESDTDYQWSGATFQARGQATSWTYVLQIKELIGPGTFNEVRFTGASIKRYADNYHIARAVGTDHSQYQEGHGNPYFFASDLPSSDTWYLLVGHIYGSGTVFPNNNEFIKHKDSGIFNINGDKVAEIMQDFVWLDGATATSFRAFAYDSSQTVDEQYRTWFMEPRVDEINDNTPSLYQILINSYSILNEGSCEHSSLEWSKAENRVSLKFDTPLQSGDVIKSYRRGVFSNYDGMPDVKKYLQDSYYYQKFSYVLKTGIDTKRWTDNFKRVSHPAGFIFFGEIEVFSYILGEGARMPKWQPGSQTASSDKVIFVPLNNYGKDINIISMRIDTEFSIGPETPNRLGPYDHLENIKFKSWAHVGDYGKFTIQDAINKDINIHMGSIVTINEPEGYDEIP